MTPDAPVVVDFLWMLILNPLFGPLNRLLKNAGLSRLAIPWLGLPETALVTIAAVDAFGRHSLAHAAHGTGVEGMAER